MMCERPLMCTVKIAPGAGPAHALRFAAADRLQGWTEGGICWYNQAFNTLLLKYVEGCPAKAIPTSFFS